MLDSPSGALSPATAVRQNNGHVVSWPLRGGRQSAQADGLTFRLPARSQLFGQSEEIGTTFEVLEGGVMLSRLLKDGRRQIVDLLGPGRMFGYAMAPVQEVTAETLTMSDIRMLGPDVEISPARVNGELRMAIERLQNHTVLLGRKTALERVASGIVSLAVLLVGQRVEHVDGPVAFRLPMTRADLADWLGLVLETVSRNLGQLQRYGLIAIERQDRLQILDMAGLKQVAAYESRAN